MTSPGDTSGGQMPSPERYNRHLTPEEMLERLANTYEGWQIGGRVMAVVSRSEGKPGFMSSFGKKGTEIRLCVPHQAQTSRPALIMDASWADHPDETPQDMLHPSLSCLLTLTRAGLRGTTKLLGKATPEGRAERRIMVESIILACTADTEEEQASSEREFADMFVGYVGIDKQDNPLDIGPEMSITVAQELVRRTRQLFTSLEDESGLRMAE